MELIPLALESESVLLEGEVYYWNIIIPSDLPHWKVSEVPYVATFNVLVTKNAGPLSNTHLSPLPLPCENAVVSVV